MYPQFFISDDFIHEIRMHVPYLFKINVHKLYKSSEEYLQLNRNCRYRSMYMLKQLIKKWKNH
ncbi:hypothetical protein ABD90_00185 [Lysinibacillus fusiformis]|uniref:Uncharacterized protein n=1 Tax=Lysinibacillus sphaericus CBAM5 TaxID=1400869 RepID=W7S596_LYSSH|nr:hypothetical protein AR327_15615 [Lysinibacillus sphaericus]EWH30923.1 hypothetical protein P799_22090 [Lysinibacillus sphaericus CBAM5]MBG9723731.1 hypothetical protein [Lysinibacillus fusiformis]AMR91132.1 hypothetical protein A1T07_13595 [Lysinibacillus sphaericus]ANA45181.1 hypothetical protein A2J09_06260 [Lysinibacillus sphaericus]